MTNLPQNSGNFPNPLKQVVAVIATVTLIGLALMFSVVVIAFVLVAGTLGWGYLWWKTRELRKQMRNYPPRSAEMDGEAAGGEEFRGEEFRGEVIEGEVIEGEVIRVVEPAEKQ